AVMVTGPFMPAEQQAVLQARATTTCRVMSQADNFQLMAAADAVVSMGGYNSVCEALAVARPLVIVPRATHKVEQQIRAETLAARGLARWVHPRDLAGPRLAEALRWGVRSRGGEERVYALKAYSDDVGERVWTHAVQLAERLPTRHDRPSLPIRYLPQERVLVFDWVEGRILSKIVDGRKPELLRQAAAVAADLHRASLVPEQPTTAQMLVAETRARCDNLRPVWPATADLVEPLLAE